MTDTAPVTLNCNVLLNQTNQRILDCCMQQEHSLSELVSTLHLEMNEVHYRVQQLCKAGILQVGRLEKRAGRAIKFYVPTRPAFFLPFSDTPYVTVMEFMAQQLDPITRKFLDLVFRAAPVQKEWGIHFRFNAEQGGLTAVFGEEGTDLGLSLEQHALKHRSLGMWNMLDLLPEDARELHTELLQVYEKYLARQHPQGKKHLIGLFFTQGDLHGSQ